MIMSKRLFKIGALLLGLCASLNYLVALRVLLDTDHKDPAWMGGSKMDELTKATIIEKRKWRVRANVTVVKKAHGVGMSLEHGRDHHAGIRTTKLEEEAKANNVTDELRATATQNTPLSKAPEISFHTVASVANPKNVTVALSQGASRVNDEGNPPLITEINLEQSTWQANVTATKAVGAGTSFEHERDHAGIRRTKLEEEAKANVTDELRASATQETALNKAPKINFHTETSVASAKNVTVALSRGASQVNNEGDPPLITGSNPEQSLALVADESKANVTKYGTSFEDRRFPRYGTAAFTRRCPWATQNPVKKRNCTILARPLPPFQEGVSNWVAQIAAGRILAQQTGCEFLMDYGYFNKTMDIVNIHQVLTPFTNHHDSDHPPINWTVPPGFHCIEGQLCFIAQPGYNHRGDSLTKIENALGTGNLSDTPMYRFGYAMSESMWLYDDLFRDLGRTLSGYTVETGMACAIGSVFELAPSATQFEPELFSRILPTLHSRDALVISLYIRTGQADFNTHQEEKGGGKFAPEDTANHLKKADKILKCALHLEKEQLQERSYSRVVWMVVTDSQYLKNWLTESYDTRYANATTSDSTIGREVVTTRSRGAHTRSRRGPSTVDFAEAMIDWYLIGESDLVVSDDHSVSFGGTATLRTARPLYKPPYYDNSYVCSRAVLVHKRHNASVS